MRPWRTLSSPSRGLPGSSVCVHGASLTSSLKPKPRQRRGRQNKPRPRVSRRSDVERSVSSTRRTRLPTRRSMRRCGVGERPSLHCSSVTPPHNHRIAPQRRPRPRQRLRPRPRQRLRQKLKPRPRQRLRPRPRQRLRPRPRQRLRSHAQRQRHPLQSQPRKADLLSTSPPWVVPRSVVEAPRRQPALSRGQPATRADPCAVLP